MPHRSFLEVLKGEERKHVHLRSSANEVIDNDEADTPGLSQTLTNERGSVNGDLSRPLPHDTVDSVNGDSIIETPESSSRSDSPVNSSLRLLSPSSAELGLWRQAWEEVVSELEEMLPLEFQSIEALDTLGQVREVQRVASERAQDRHQQERKIPGTNKTYREIYGKVANCANKFQIVGDMVTQAEPIYAALPWALVRFVIQCAVGEDEAYRTMLEAAELVSDLVSQYPALEKLYAGIDSDLSKKLRKSLVSFYRTILQFQVYAIKYFDPHSKGRRTVLGLNPVTAENIKHRRQEIDGLKLQVDGDAALVSYEVSKTGIDNFKVGQESQKKQLETIKEGIIALSGDTGQAIRGLSREQEERNKILIDMWKEPLDDLRMGIESRELEKKARTNLHNVRRWLSVAMPWDDLLAAREKRDMPVGDWLINNQKFKDWRVLEESSILWLFGFPGTGKTGLACRVIHELEPSTQNTGRTAFFFCSSDSASAGSNESFSRSDPEEALRSVVSQLATSRESNYVAPILQSKYGIYGPDSDQSMKLASSECIDVIVTVSKYTPVTIVLDAFDECDQSRSPRLIWHLEEIIRQSPTNVKIFISTRAFPAIEDKLKPDRSIEVTADNNGVDVQTFVRSTLEKRIKDRTLLRGDVPDDLRTEIEVTLTNRAGNMFLYASLLLEQLCDQNYDDPESIRKRLGSLPRDLADVYKRIMTEIHDENTSSERSRFIAKSTFRWLLCALEPLGSDALLEAISPPDRKAKHEDVIRACRTLVVKGRNNYEFAHYSVREHIGQFEEYTPSQCHLVATQSCLNILDTSFGTDRRRQGLSDAQKEFEQYALLYWPLHYEGVKRDDMRSQRTGIDNLLRSLLLQGRGPRNKYHEWFEEVSKRENQLKDNKYLASKLNAIKASPMSPLFAACVFGLEDLIAKFGRELDALNRVNDSGQTALCLAIEHNKLDVVKALLTRRFPADANLLNMRAVAQWVSWETGPHDTILYASAMQCAAATGRLDIAEYLTEHGAHIDLVAGYYGSPLQAAAYQGHAQLVEFLLSRGAEPNSQGGYHGNALQAAAAAGHTTIINLLLENKPAALVNIPGGHYGSALRAAVHSGSSDAVWALIEEKANANVKVNGHDSLLDEAASMGPTHRDIVRDLIDAEAEADFSPKGNGVHIMHLAAMFGMTELIEHCLDKNCQIGAVTTQGPNYPRRFGDFPSEMTPLGYACAEGHVNIVDLLLHHNASFEEDKPNSAILWTAAYQGHAEVVELLLGRYKETHSPDETAKFLLQGPAPRSGHPILFAAASSGKADVVKSLIKHGAKYESNWFKSTPLYATATFGCPDVTELLLRYHHHQEIDICINQKNDDGRTAFYEACFKEQPLIAKKLLDAGADYRTVEKDNTTPLQISCFHGIFSIVSAIIEKASQELERTQFSDYINTRHRPTGNVALIDCCERNHLSCLNLLLDHGADYKIPGNGNYTILHMASRHDNSAIMATIVSKAARDLDRQHFLNFLNTRHSSGKTALIDCAERGRVESMSILLRNGADYKISGHAGNTPLHWGCIEGHDKIVKTILEHAESINSDTLPAYINHGNNAGLTPLMEAAGPNHLAVVKTLLSFGANYVTGRIGRELSSGTALHDACFRGSREVVMHLLEVASQDPDEKRFLQFVNARNGQGKTALHDCASSGKSHMIKLLSSQYKADYLTWDNKDATPLHSACFRGHTEAVASLLESASRDEDRERFVSLLNRRNRWGKTALFDACKQAHPEIVRMLLENGADYTIATPLHIACWLGRPKVAATLLEFASKDKDRARFTSAFLNVKNKYCNTPLMDACQSGRPDIAQMLLEHGADYRLTDDKGFTALHYSAFRDRINCVRALLEYAHHHQGPNGFQEFINQQGTNNGASALHDVARQGHTNVAKLILEYQPAYDSLDSSKRHPLHHAVARENEDLARALLEYAAKDGDKQRFKNFLNARDQDGETVWKYATKKTMKTIVDILKASRVVET